MIFLGVLLFINIFSVVGFFYLGKILNINFLVHGCDYLVTRQYSILNFLTAIFMFLCFKNIKLKNISFINSIANSTLGIYLIHDNDIIRNWLWKDFWPSSLYLNSKFYILHMFSKVTIVFFICLAIDKIRIIVCDKKIDKLIEFIKNKYLKNKFIRGKVNE